jgi:hypothetical protein
MPEFIIVAPYSKEDARTATAVDSDNESDQGQDSGLVDGDKRKFAITKDTTGRGLDSAIADLIAIYIRGMGEHMAADVKAMEGGTGVEAHGSIKKELMAIDNIKRNLEALKNGGKTTADIRAELTNFRPAYFDPRMLTLIEGIYKHLNKEDVTIAVQFFPRDQDRNRSGARRIP